MNTTSAKSEAAAEIARLTEVARAAIRVRDAIDSCTSPEWLAAHKVARLAYRARDLVETAAQKAGLVKTEYWETATMYDEPEWAAKQMADYGWWKN